MKIMGFWKIVGWNYMYWTHVFNKDMQARSHVKSVDRTIKLESILTSLSGASKASGGYNGVGFRGPLKGPWWGPGAEPRRGSRGQSPRKLCDFGNLEGSREALMALILQCFSAAK